MHLFIYLFFFFYLFIFSIYLFIYLFVYLFIHLFFLFSYFLYAKNDIGRIRTYAPDGNCLAGSRLDHSATMSYNILDVWTVWRITKADRTQKYEHWSIFMKILFYFVFFLSFFIYFFVYLFSFTYRLSIHLLRFVCRYRKCTSIHALCTSHFHTAPPSMGKCMHLKFTWHYVHRNTQIVATNTQVCLELTDTHLFIYFVYSPPSLPPSIHSFIYSPLKWSKKI